MGIVTYIQRRRKLSAVAGGGASLPTTLILGGGGGGRGGSRSFDRGGGSRLGLPAKGGADGGPILSPMLKSLHRGTKGGGVLTPWTPPGSATGGGQNILWPPQLFQTDRQTYGSMYACARTHTRTPLDNAPTLVPVWTYGVVGRGSQRVENTAGLYAAPVRVEVHVAQLFQGAQVHGHGRLAVGVPTVHVVGAAWVQTHRPVLVLKPGPRRVKPCMGAARKMERKRWLAYRNGASDAFFLSFSSQFGSES